jgi:ABC-type multidrug transport system fused ATPase/permease subunit
VQLLTAFLQVLTEVVYLLDEMSEGRRATSEVAPHLHRVDEATACLPSDLASARLNDRKGGDTGREAVQAPNFLGDGGIQFVGVSFSYSPELEPVIRRMSCHIPARRFTCLVGESGSGKSTALGLLTREIQEQRGKVLVDGQRLSEFDPAAIRSRMAVVQQQVSGSNVSNPPHLIPAQ